MKKNIPVLPDTKKYNKHILWCKNAARYIKHTNVCLSWHMSFT